MVIEFFAMLMICGVGAAVESMFDRPEGLG